MKRALILAAALAAACGGSEKTQISVFAASPDTIQVGGTTALVFGASNAASISIDNGIGDVTGKDHVYVSPTQTTTYTITSTSKDNVTDSKAVTVTVVAARASSYTVEGPATATAGASVALTVTARGPDGAALDTFVGTATLATDDAAATLPHLATFASGAHGKATVQATFKTAGQHQITASDAQARGAAAIAVGNAAAAALALSGAPDTAHAGDAVALRITALDAFGNVARDFAGTVALASSDAAAAVPATVAFTSADAGVKNVSLSFATASAATLTATSGAMQATANVTVKNAAASGFDVANAPATAIAGDDVTVTVIAKDRFGNVAVDFTGTVHVTATDGASTDVTFAAGDAGQKAATLNLSAAGVQTISASTSTISGAATVNVHHGGAVAYQLSAVPGSISAGTPVALNVSAVDAKGNVVTSYAGTAHVSSPEATDILPADGAFTNGVRTVSFVMLKAGSRAITVSELGGTITASTGAVAVSAAAAQRVAISGAPSSAQAGASLSATLTVLDHFGNTAAFTGNIHLVVTDPNGTVSDAAATNGVATASFAFATTGKQSLVVSDAVLSGSAELDVTPAQATHYVLAPLPSIAVAGQALTLAATALDSFGNVDTAYNATAHVAGSAGDILPPDTAFAGGQLSVGVSFTSAGSHSVTLSQVAGTISRISTIVTVTSDNAVSLVVASGSATAGAPASVGIQAVDRYGNQVPTYAGVVDFASNDAQFVSPGATSFAGAGGVKTVPATFKTAGAMRIDAHDVQAASIAGGAAWAVAPAAASACAIDLAPAAATSGATIGFRVSLADAFGNKATNYAGTVGVTSSDSAAQFARSSYTYVPATDAGAHAFTVQLMTTGLQSVTATDSGNAAVTCAFQTTVVAPSVHYVVTLPANANVGAATTATITVLNAVNAVIPDYAGTMTFTSSDAAAVLPANVVFDGTQNGTTTVPVTFNTTGSQTFVATEAGNPGVTGTASVPVHGLFYSNPPSNLGILQLVANNTSTPGLVQLDLVVRTTVRNGFGAGMNLPADSTRVVADATPIVAGTALGTTGVTFTTAAKQTGNTLFSVHSRQNTSAGAGSDVQLAAGTVVYSVRVKLNGSAQVGTVFDGSGVVPGFRAAVRDRLGNDTVAQNDFAIGKLEVR